MADPLGELREKLSQLEQERADLDGILGSVFIPHARNGRMVPLVERARAFRDAANKYHKLIAGLQRALAEALPTSGARD